MADADFTRSVSRWLRAYPRRWRAVRAAEVTDLLADLAPEGARRLDLRSGLGLVRAGWATRWREHPPLLGWLGYVLFERRLGPRYRDWVADDIAGAAYPVRRLMLGASIPLLFGLVPVLGGAHLSPDFFLYVVPMLLLVSGLRGRSTRDHAIAVHLALQPGDVVTPTARIHALVPRTRVDARSALTVGVRLTAGALALGVLLVALVPTRLDVARSGGAELSVTTVAVHPGARVPALLAVAGAVVLGLLLAPVAAGRLRRWQPTPQPTRAVVPLSAHGRWRTAAITAAAVAMLVAWPGGRVVGPLPLALASGAVLPVLVAARAAVVGGRTRAVAGIEVRRALLGRPDPADPPVPGYLPATTWLPAGTVAPPPEPRALAAGAADPYRA